MKRYCLNQRAKNQLNIFLFAVNTTLTAIIIAAMIALLGGEIYDFAIYVGGLGWCALIAYLVVVIPMWFYRNLEERK